MGISKPGVVIPVPISPSEMPEEYLAFIKQIKDTIAQQRLKTILAANTSMTMLYWRLGHAILERQRNEGWGAKVIDRMSFDLKKNFQTCLDFCHIT